MPFRRPRHPLRWLVTAVVVVAVLAVGGPFVYIHLLSGSTPAQLSLRPSAGHSSSGSPASGSGTSDASTKTVDGTWAAATGSQVQYRVKEVLLGQGQTAVGTSRSVTGRLIIANGKVTAASFSVPMGTIKSDKSQRNAQFDGRIMDVAAYPTGKFTLTSPISLGSLPAAGTARTYTAHGNLELHGRTRAVTFTVQAERAGNQIKVAGHIGVVFADWGISNPSIGSFVTTQNHGLLEFLLILRKT